MPPLRSARQDALSDSDIGQIIGACRDVKDQLVIVVPLFAGLRVGELAHLNITWIDWKQLTIDIPQRQYCWCWDCRHYRGGVWEPKTRAAIRSVIISPEVEGILRQFFHTKTEVGVSRQAIEARVARIAKRTGIKHPVYPHALRATAATLFASKGMSMPTVRYLMGWERLATAELYVQSTKARALEEARAKMG